MVPPPAVSLVKTERVGTTGAFVRGPVRGTVGQRVDYRLTVTNTGTVTIKATVTDPGCDAGTLKPVGAAVLNPGASFTFTCSHLLRARDGSTYVNVAVTTATASNGAQATATSRVLATVVRGRGPRDAEDRQEEGEAEGQAGDQEGEAGEACHRRSLLHRMRIAPATRVAAFLAAAAALLAAAAPGTASAATPNESIVAEAKVPVVAVYRTPSAKRAFLRLSNPTGHGGPLVFLVKERRPGWEKVYLPVRPNGSTGWIRDAQVTLALNTYRVRVSLGGHTITVWNGKKIILHEPAGVGRSIVPTPAGTYYLAELLAQPNPNGAYGPYAFGLSAHSNVLYSFGGGSGPDRSPRHGQARFARHEREPRLHPDQQRRNHEARKDPAARNSRED